MKLLPDIDILRKSFSYDPDTGHFARRYKSKTSSRSSPEYVVSNGYRHIWFDGQRYLSHRVAWKMHYGVDPDSEIDHINGDTGDNRITNLRLANRSTNMYNSKVRSNSNSGLKGVAYRKDNGKWRAYITVDRKRKNLGQYDTAAEANSAVMASRELLHGDFANHGT